MNPTTFLMIALVVLLWAVVLFAGAYTLWALWDFARSLPRRHRVTRWLFVGNFSLLILGTLAFSAWVLNSQRLLHNELSRIREAGEPVTLTELSRKNPPDSSSEDASTHYRAAFELTQVARQQSVDAGDDEKTERKALEIAYRDWLEGRSDQPPTEVQRARANLLLERHRPSLEQADRASEIEGCRFDWGFSTGGLVGVFPSLGKVRDVANWLSFRTVVCLGEGDINGAFRSAESQRRMLRIFDNINNKNVLITYLVRVAIAALINDDVFTITSSGAANDESLRRLAAGLAERDRPQDFTETLMAERVFGLALMGVAQAETDQPIPGSWGSSDVPGFVRNAMAVSYVDFMRRCIETSKLPFHEGVVAMGEVRSRGVYGVITDTLVPSLARAMVLSGRAITGTRAARLAIACELYRREHGNLPEKLDALVPAHAEAVLVDPFDGNPMKYRREGDTVVIYSVGDNRVDDGGKLETVGDEKEPLDWGFRVKLGVRQHEPRP